MYNLTVCSSTLTSSNFISKSIAISKSRLLLMSSAHILFRTVTGFNKIKLYTTIKIGNRIF